MPTTFLSNNTKRTGIRKRVLNTVLIITLVALIVAITTSIICMLIIRKEGEKGLTRQLEQNLTSIVAQQAENADVKFEHYEKYIEFITDYIENMYKGRESLIKMGHFFDAPRTTTAPGEYAMQSTYMTKAVTTESVLDEIYFFSNLEQVWEPIAKENEDIITTVYAGIPEGLLSCYDRWSSLAYVPEGEMLYYDYRDSGWYKKGLAERNVFYTSLYADVYGRGLTITVAKSFYDQQGNFRGVSCADYDITSLYDQMISVDLGEGAYSFAIDDEHNIISLDASEKISAIEYTGLSKADFNNLISGSTGILEKSDAFYVYTPIERVGWTLCAYVPRSIISERIKTVDKSIIYAIIIFIIISALIVLSVLLSSNRIAKSITLPIELLGKDMEIIANGNLEHKALAYRDDEIGDATVRLNEMVERLKDTLQKLFETKQQAEQMTELANKDALTGIRNKTSYDKEFKNLEWKLINGDKKIGFAMIDLNFLKKINDTFGHDKGNIAIKKLCATICTTFTHSPVFRIGGDEFVVILEGHDYDNRDALINQFNEVLEGYKNDESLEPWEQPSAAIGYALFDEKIDSSVDNVFKRADSAMYECKKAMKATRE